MNDLGCADVRPLLEQLVDCDLDPATTTAVRQHLAGCRDCRRQHEEAVSIPTRLRAMRGPEPPSELLTRVLRAVAEVRTRDKAAGLIIWRPVVVEVILSAIIAWYVSGFAGLAGITSASVGEVTELFGWSSGSEALPAPTADLVLVLACISLVGVTAYHLILIARSTGSLGRDRRPA